MDDELRDKHFDKVTEPVTDIRSCKACRALVRHADLEEHAMWHVALRQNINMAAVS